MSLSNEDVEESDYEYESSDDDDFPCEIAERECSACLFNLVPISCTICREDRVEEGCALTLPSCGHSFCVECFTSYLDAEIALGKADDIMCPFILEGGEHGQMGRKCGEAVGTDVLHEIMTQDKYDNLLRLRDAAFVRKNVDYHHCPYPDCDNIVLCKSYEADEEDDKDHGVGGSARICDCFKCGNTSCLSCGAMPFHTNKTCEEHERDQKRKQEYEKRMETAIRATRHAQMQMQFPTVDRSRANEEAKYDFDINLDDGINDEDSVRELAENACDALSNVKRCRRCGNGVEHREGCLKMKCICGYRFCYQCGSENAQCECTPASHGFFDNKTGMGDMAGIHMQKSFT